MNKDFSKLFDAVQLIEQSGGFAMLPDEVENEMNKFRIEDLKKQKAELKAEQKEYANRLRSAYRGATKVMNEQIKDERFSFEEIENAFLDEGIDLDEIENWIHSFY